MLKLSIFLSLSLSANAFAGAFACIDNSKLSDIEAQRKADLLQHTYSKVKWFSARFEQDSYLAALDMSESSSGQVWFHNPGEMKWHYKLPEEQIFVLRKQSLWLYQKSHEQVFIDELKSVLSSDLPVAFLMGIGDLQESFQLLGGCETPSGFALEFVPKTSAPADTNALQQITLLVEKKRNLPIGAIIFDPAGNRNQFLFTWAKGGRRNQLELCPLSVVSSPDVLPSSPLDVQKIRSIPRLCLAPWRQPVLISLMT
jgi:outer membrane lipoprotein-sorting protein